MSDAGLDFDLGEMADTIREVFMRSAIPTAYRSPRGKALS